MCGNWNVKQTTSVQVFKVTTFCTDTCFQSFLPLINCIEDGSTVCPPCRSRLFMRLTVSAVEAPKVTQISLNLNDRSPVKKLQITVSVFRLNYAFRLIVGGLMVCTFYAGFCVNYRFAVTKLLSNLPCFRNFDDATNTVASQMFFYSAPQCSHCKGCTSYGISVCLSVRLCVCHTPLLCQNDGT